MEIRVFGSRGSHCVSGAEFTRYGGLTPCVCVQCGKFWIVFDAGMGLVKAGEHILYDSTAAKTVFLFLSHLHNDHIEGINFFKPLYIGNYHVRFSGFGGSSDILLDRISTTFSPPYFPLALDELKSQLEITSISEEQVMVFDDNAGTYVIRNVFTDEFIKGDFSISNWYHPSHPKDGSLVYKLNYGGKVLVYATDIELYGGGLDRRMERLCRNADMVFIDSQYTDEQYFDEGHVVQGYGHSYHSAVIRFGQAANIKKLRFFHHDPEATDDQLDAVDAALKKINPEWGCAYTGEILHL